eukprot:c13851_g1_i1.p1 GENE.c13851_g1_i1~~c13851_g1_i1.p1  ORF type:complete len:1015 (+),score=222.32 c13851_g1_i1:144-3047(+)
MIEECRRQGDADFQYRAPNSNEEFTIFLDDKLQRNDRTMFYRRIRFTEFPAEKEAKSFAEQIPQAKKFVQYARFIHSNAPNPTQAVLDEVRQSYRLRDNIEAEKLIHMTNRIEGATKDALFDLLFDLRYLDADETYFEDFFNTYETIFTDQEMLQGFRRVYQTPGKSFAPLVGWLSILVESSLAHVQYNMPPFSTESPPDPEESPPILVAVAAFLQELEIPESERKFVSEAFQWRGRLNPKSAVGSFYDNYIEGIQWDTLDPGHLAGMLTHLTAGLFRSIQIRSELSNLKFKPGMDKMAFQFNALSDFVQETILASPNTDVATSRAKFWLTAGLECLETYHNFNDALCIHSVFDLQVIRRLKVVMGAVVEMPEFKLLNEKGKPVFETQFRHKYTTYLEHAPRPLIPYLGVYLSEATFIGEMVDCLPYEPSHLNFDKRRKLSRLIRTLSEYRQGCEYAALAKMNQPPHSSEIKKLARHLEHHVRPSVAQFVRMSYELEPDPCDVLQYPRRSFIPRQKAPPLVALSNKQTSLISGKIDVQISVQEVMGGLLDSEMRYIKLLAAFKEYEQLFTAVEDEGLLEIFDTADTLCEKHKRLFNLVKAMEYQLENVCSVLTEYLGLGTLYIRFNELLPAMQAAVEARLNDEPFAIKHHAVRHSLPRSNQLTLLELLNEPTNRMKRYFQRVEAVAKAAGDDIDQIEKLKRLAAETQAKVAISSLTAEAKEKVAKLFGIELPCLLFGSLKKRSRDGTYKTRDFGLFEDRLVYKSGKNTFELSIDQLVHVEHVLDSPASFKVYHKRMSFLVLGNTEHVADEWVSQLSLAMIRVTNHETITSAPIFAQPSKECSNCHTSSWTQIKNRCQLCGACICAKCTDKKREECLATFAQDCATRCLESCKTRASNTTGVTLPPAFRSVEMSYFNEHESLDEESHATTLVSEIRADNYDSVYKALGLHQPDKQELLRAIFELMKGQ